jgi:hypothetical protein
MDGISTRLAWASPGACTTASCIDRLQKFNQHLPAATMKTNFAQGDETPRIFQVHGEDRGQQQG